MIDISNITPGATHAMLVPSLSASYLHLVMAYLDPAFKDILPRLKYKQDTQKKELGTRYPNETDDMNALTAQLVKDFPEQSDITENHYAHKIITRVPHDDVVCIAKSLDINSETVDPDFLKEILEEQKHFQNGEYEGYRLNRQAFIKTA